MARADPIILVPVGLNVFDTLFKHKLGVNNLDEDENENVKRVDEEDEAKEEEAEKIDDESFKEDSGVDSSMFTTTEPYLPPTTSHMHESRVSCMEL
jgi:hypothetical protein